MVKAFHSHIPKCGGTWINDVFKETPEVVSFDTLLPQDHLSDCEHFGFIRNPWAWYVSWFNFKLHGSEIVTEVQPAIFYCSNEIKTFDDCVRNFSKPSEKFKKQMFNSCHQHTFSTSSFRVFGKWVNSDESYLEHMYSLYFREDSHIGKLENSRDDLTNICWNIDILTPELESRIMTRSHKQVGTKKVDYRTFYTDESAQLVADTHKRIIDKHGYTFD